MANNAESPSRINKVAKMVNLVKTDTFRGNASFLLLQGLVIIALAMYFALPSVVMIFFGLLPAIIAFILDETPGHPVAITIFAACLCVLTSMLLDLWIHQHTLIYAIKILTSFENILLIAVSIIIVLLLLYFISPLIGRIIARQTNAYIAELKTRQQELISEWGEDIVPVRIKSNQQQNRDQDEEEAWSEEEEAKEPRLDDDKPNDRS